MRKYTAYIVAMVASWLVQDGVQGQNALAKGDALSDIPVKRVLNHPGPVTSLAGLKNKITVVDFFATWCAPCLRALPQLAEIKNTFRNEVNIILVSNETEEQLSRFIGRRQPFAFPIIVDEANQWNALFQPPSLPYTVIIKDGKVIAITEAEKITSRTIEAWLNSPSTGQEMPPGKEMKLQPMPANNKSNNAAVRLSQDFIYAAKTSNDTESYLSQLSALPYSSLENLSSDRDKKAFWINVYNGYTQAALQSDPDRYKKRSEFFKAKALVVAGQKFSLDDIEHGVLRHSKVKWSLGYFNKLFPSGKEKDLRVDKVDYRIHFALNCGAKSCPPIAFYNNETLDAQLDLATKAYLTSEVSYDPAGNIVYLPKLMSWFRADFGGKKGMKKILRQHQVIPPGADPRIKFKDYDWTLSLNNYTNQNP